jgi:archaellin
MPENKVIENKRFQMIAYAFDQPIGGAGGIAPGTTSQAAIQVNTRDFLCKKIAQSSTGDYLVQLIDNTNNQIFNKPVLASLLFSDSKTNNRPLSFARLFKGKETITIQVTDVSGAANKIYFALEGAEVLS